MPRRVCSSADRHELVANMLERCVEIVAHALKGLLEPPSATAPIAASAGVVVLAHGD